MLSQSINFLPFLAVSTIFVSSSYYNDIDFYKNFQLNESFLTPGTLGDFLSSISVFDLFVSPLLFLIYLRYIIGVAHPYLASFQLNILFLLFSFSSPFLLFFTNILPQGLATLLIAHSILLYGTHTKATFFLFTLSFFVHPISIAFIAAFLLYVVNGYFRYLVLISMPLVIFYTFPFLFQFIPSNSNNFGDFDLSYPILIFSFFSLFFFYSTERLRIFFIGLIGIQILIILAHAPIVLIERFFYSCLLLFLLLLNRGQPFGRRFSFGLLVLLLIPFLTLSLYVLKFHYS